MNTRFDCRGHGRGARERAAPCGEAIHALAASRRRSLAAHRTGLVKPVSIDITALGSVSVLTVLTLLAVGYLLLERRSGAAVFVLIATIGGTALSEGLKSLFARERPDVVPPLATFSNASYPGGHSMLSTVVYLTLAVVLAETLSRRRTKIYLLAFLIGVSRVVIGVHYPTDVLAGWAAGTAWAPLCWLAAVRLKRRGVLNRPNPTLKSPLKP